MKKSKLNELKEEAKEKEMELEELKVTSMDCKKMIVKERENQYVTHLNHDMQNLEEDIIEIEAKNRLYTLLSERTR